MSDDGPPLVSVGEQAFVNLRFDQADDGSATSAAGLDAQSHWLMLSYPDGVLAVPLEQG